MAAVIDTESGEEIIFGNDVDIDDIIWMGPQPLMEEKAKLVGVDKTAPFSKLAEYIGKQTVERFISFRRIDMQTRYCCTNCLLFRLRR